MTKLEKVIDSCLVIFDLTSRSVPSNHVAKINAEIEKLKQVKLELKEFDNATEEKHEPKSIQSKRINGNEAR